MPAKLSSNLDFLRAVAVLLVLAQHLLNRFLGEGPGSTIPPIGTFGVLLFFVHTSLVLMYSMERSHLDGTPLVGNFYLRRVFRIYPLSILAVLTAVALHLDWGVNGRSALSYGPPVGIGRILSNLFLVQNLVKPGSIINVLWSLPYEIQMYVFLPFLFMWIGNWNVRGRQKAVRNVCLLWTAFVVIGVARRYITAHGIVGSFVGRLSLLMYVPNFLPGVIAYTLAHEAKIKSYLWPPFILLLVGVYLIHPGASLGWVMCLLLGFAIPFFGEIKTGWLRKVSHQIATYSYGIYLSHQFCIWFAFDPLGAWPLWSKIAVLVVSLVGIPILLYHTVEKPMIKIGAELAEKWTTRHLATTAPA